MLALEASARTAGLGLWQNPQFAVRDAARTTTKLSGFQLVEGVVQAVGVGRDRVYLNFGSDWRSDFTLMILRRDASKFPGRLAGLRKLEGQRVRARGWVFHMNGPAIRADHPAMIEVLKKP
jgi:hypothetical protein